ncbi:MAG: GNAT family N-acetyltransferase [Saprospiraceae bacterium]|nr:GNAT family N-acetyltransferase [Saprospiraceae bacterium]
MPNLETDRLLIRPAVADDFELVFRMQQDPEVMRYIRPPETDPEVVRGRMAMWLKYNEQNPGLGVFICLWKDTGEPAGNCVFRHVEYLPGNDLEVGYLILRPFWGQGLATEIVGALVRCAFEEMKAPKLLAYVDPENAASQRVLQKNGFLLVGNKQIYGTENFEFELLAQPTLP